MKNLFDNYLQYVIGVLLGILTWGIIGAIDVHAAPISGVTYQLYSQQMRAPIAPWQQDILENINEEPKEEINDRRSKRAIKKRPILDNGFRGNSGRHLTRQSGIFAGPSGKETFYNLPMGGVVRYMGSLGYDYRYWIREDGVKMLGPYVMCAADLSIRPKGTILETSLGTGIVCDTGEFVKTNACQLDIATNW